MRLYDNLKCLLLDYGLLWDFDTQSRKSPVFLFQLCGCCCCCCCYCLSTWNPNLMQMFSLDNFFLLFGWKKFWQSKCTGQHENRTKWTRKRKRGKTFTFFGHISAQNRALLAYWICKAIAWSFCFCINITIMSARGIEKTCVDIKMYLRTKTRCTKNVQYKNEIELPAWMSKIPPAMSALIITLRPAAFKCVQFKVIVIQCKSIDWECFSTAIYSRK